MSTTTLRNIFLDLFRLDGKVENDIIRVVKHGYDREYISYSFLVHFCFYFLLLFPPYFHQTTEILPFLVGISISRFVLLIQNFNKGGNLRYIIFVMGIISDGFFYVAIGKALIFQPTLENFYLSNAYLTVSSILILLYSLRLERLSCLFASFYFIVFHITYINFLPMEIQLQTSFFARSFPILTYLGSGLIGTVFILNKRKSISYLYKLSEERRFIQQELELAKKVQDALFPKDIKIPGIKYKYYRKNPNVIGGDFFDFVQLREGNVGVFLTDVAGHGISSAMVASIMKVLVSTIPYRFKLSPAKLLEYLDEKLVNDLNKYHASAIYLFFDFIERKVKIGNAGHPYLIHSPKGMDFYEIETEGAILGFNICNPIAVEKTVSFQSGDRFFVYTDGLIESIASNGIELGTDGLLKILNQHKDVQKLSNLESEILADIKAEFGIYSFLDDTMFLILEIE